MFYGLEEEIMKLKNRGFILLDSLLSFMVILVVINLVSSYSLLNHKNIKLEYNDFSHYVQLNNIFFREGVDDRYDEMFERVLSY